MRRMKQGFRLISSATFLTWAAVAILFAGAFPLRSIAQENGQKTFSSPEEASKALVNAARNNDQKVMLDVLGPDAKQIVDSGDDVQDAHDRQDFVQKYQMMHRFVKEPDGTTTLYIGAENWPTPIPLMNKGKTWYFDTTDAKKEILYRRLGQNEMSTIRVCQNWSPRKKNIIPPSTRCLRGKSSATTTRKMVCTGPPHPDSPEARLALFWPPPLLKVTPLPETPSPHRFTATTTTCSSARGKTRPVERRVTFRTAK